MRLSGLAALVVAAFASEGCLVVAFNPIYDDRTIEFDERLLGTWENAEEESSLAISRGTWRSYDVTYTKGETSLRLTAVGTRIGEGHFLDLAHERGVDTLPLMLAAHAVVRVRLLGETLTVDGFDYEWWMRAAGQGSLKKLRFAIDERQNLVLTSPTAVLREWIAGAQGSEEAYGDPLTFVRRR